MKIISNQLFLIVLIFPFILNKEIEIPSFYKFRLTRDNPKLIYYFTPNNSSIYQGLHYFFFGISGASSIKVWIYEEGQKSYTDRIDLEYENYFYCYKIENITSQKYKLEVSSSSWGGDLIFIDNSKEITMNLSDFINFNLETRNSYQGPTFPLIFNIQTDFKSIVKFDYDKYAFYNSSYLLEYCEVNGESKCEYKGINKTAIFEKGKMYKVKYNSNIRYSDQFEFSPFETYNTFEIKCYDFVSYQLSSNHKTLYYLLDVKKFDKFYIYIETDPDEFYSRFINASDSENIEKIRQYSYEEKSTFFGQKIFDFNNEANDYLVVKMEYGTTDKNTIFLGGISKLYDFTPDTSIELEKGEKALIQYSHDYGSCILVSSNENIKRFDSSVNSKEFTDIIITSRNEEKEKFVYVDSLNEKIKVQFFKAEFPYYAKTKLRLYCNNDIKSYLDKYGPDSLFMRMSSESSAFIFNVFYVYGFREKYYLYVKKHFGNIDFYQYKEKLNAFSNISQFEIPYYNNLDKFNLIKENLLNISGYQIFSFYNSYNSLIDFYFQKVNDSEYININPNMFKFNNLVKLLESGKLYYLNFTVDHIIKLDNKFLDSEITFTDKDGNKYILNKENKVLKNLTGDNITVISTKKSLLYFYKRINESGIIEIEFDKNQKGKLMKFNITNISGKEITANINIMKDFGFSGYYPMISEKSWDKITGKENQYTVYIENFYDKINDGELYENDGEKFIIFIYPINDQEFVISDVTYVENLLTIKNKFNLEVIPANSSSPLILNIKGVPYENYQFEMCKSKEITFNIDSSNGNFTKYNPYIKYPYTEIINENKQVVFQKYSENEILIHTFKSDNLFLFSYTFEKYMAYPYYNNSILSAFGIEKNMIQIKFHSVSDYFENYYILIAKIDDKNNIESFSDKCYISKLFIHNDFGSILVKKIYKKHKDESEYILCNIDISELKLNDNTELVITMVSYFPGELLKYYNPIKTINTVVKHIKLEETISFNLDNNYIFSFEYEHKFKDREQKLSIFFDETFYLEIYLSNNNEIKKGYYTNYYNLNFILTNSGKYFLEIHKIYGSQIDTKEGTFFTLLTDRLIDIIDLSEKEYKNDKIYTIPMEVEPNYYLVYNLTKNKTVEFTFEVKGMLLQRENPFIVCNNYTNECIENVNSYNFTKGYNYTIYIYYLLVLTQNRGDYCYPSFKMYSYDNEDEDQSDKSKGGNGENNDGLDSTTLIIIISASVVGCIFLVIIIIFIMKFVRNKKENINFKGETTELSNVNLLGSES